MANWTLETLVFKLFEHKYFSFFFISSQISQFSQISQARSQTKIFGGHVQNLGGNIFFTLRLYGFVTIQSLRLYGYKTCMYVA